MVECENNTDECEGEDEGLEHLGLVRRGVWGRGVRVRVMRVIGSLSGLELTTKTSPSLSLLPSS